MIQPMPEQLTPREAELMRAEKEENEAIRDYNLRMKQLDIEVIKLETRWRSLLRIPMTIIKLPIYLLFGIAYIVAVARKTELGQNFWDMMK